MTARDLIFAGRVLVAAHRGDSRAAPENTLPAFDAAVELGADLVELDYRHSADQIPVVFHDEQLDRTTDACDRWQLQTVELADCSLARLKELDAGSWFDAKFDGTAIPMLAEALDCIQRGSVAVLERKAGDPQTLVELLRQKSMLENVVVQAFDWAFLSECRRLAPSLALVALGEKELGPDKLEKIGRIGVQAVGWDNRSMDPAMIQAIHQLGWKAWVWTVDSPDRAQVLIAAGIDAIISNVPVEMLRLLGR